MEQRKILIALPCLVPAGGITVVVPLAKALQKMNCQVAILSQEDGDMHGVFAELGIAVWIEENITNDALIAEILENYDEVIANTLWMYSFVSRLNASKTQVKWWIHEADMLFELLAQAITQEFWDGLNENIKILAAGNVVHDYIWRNYGKENEVLNFGVEDIAHKILPANMDIVSPGKVSFLMPSALIQPVKGQDLLALAIAGLPEEYDKRMEFIFVGAETEEHREYVERLKDLLQGRTNVRILGMIGKADLMALMRQVDCVVAPSRQDPTNACIVEGMMLSKICITSDAAGVSRYMQDCVNGFVFASCNADELRARLMLVADNIERLHVISRNGRKVYEEVFSMEVFEKNVRKYWGNSYE